MQQAFVQFSEKLKPGGLLLTSYELAEKAFSSDNHIRYSLENNRADAFAANINVVGGGYEFDVIAKNWVLNGVQLNMGGMHNIENAIAAIIIANHLNINPEKIKSAVKNFKGVKRRFEYIIPLSNGSKQSSVIFIDDYAHHPQELNALISGAKSLFDGRKLTIIFQPHLFSRTKDFAKEFAESLDQADEILILPIYPARELPMEGVSANLILNFMKNKNARVITKEVLMNYIDKDYIKQDTENKLLITAGAGDIDKLVQPIKNSLLNKSV
jgi:UDP-N-acetylmuramate--alanine ligase